MEKSKKLNAQELKIYMYIRGRKILWKSVESEESSRCTWKISFEDECKGKKNSSHYRNWTVGSNNGCNFISVSEILIPIWVKFFISIQTW